MISCFSPCEVLQPVQITGSFRGRINVAKVTTDTALQELDVTELSSSIAAYGEFQRSQGTAAVTGITLNGDFSRREPALSRAGKETLVTSIGDCGHCGCLRRARECSSSEV